MCWRSSVAALHYPRNFVAGSVPMYFTLLQSRQHHHHPPHQQYEQGASRAYHPPLTRAARSLLLCDACLPTPNLQIQAMLTHSAAAQSVPTQSQAAQIVLARIEAAQIEQSPSFPTLRANQHGMYRYKTPNTRAKQAYPIRVRMLFSVAIRQDGGTSHWYVSHAALPPPRSPNLHP